MKEQPHITFVCPFEIAKVPILEAVATTLASKYGTRVCIITYGENACPSYVQDRISVIRIPLTTRSMRIFGKAFRAFAFFEFLIKTLRLIWQDKPSQLVFVNDFAALLAFFSPCVKRTFWQLEYKPGYSLGIKYRLNAFAASLAWRFVDTGVFPSYERMALAMAGSNSLLALERFVIPNTRLAIDEVNSPRDDLGDFEENDSVSRIINEAAQCGGKVIAYAGAVGKATYNLEQLIAAVGRTDNAYLLVIGAQGDETRRYFEKYILQSSATDRIALIPFVDVHTMQKILRRCDFGYASYRAVDLNTLFCAPGKIYQYLAAGIPVISDSSYARDLESVGCSVPFRTASSFSGQVDELVYLLRKIGELDIRSKEEIKEVFNSRYSLTAIEPLVLRAFQGNTDATGC